MQTPRVEKMVSRPSGMASSLFRLLVPLTFKLEEAHGKHDEAISMVARLYDLALSKSRRLDPEPAAFHR